MQISESNIAGLKLIQPEIISDERGWFAEMWNKPAFSAAGLPTHFIQDNQSHSHRGVLRGLHYQLGQPQGKLVRVVQGRVFDVAVDLRPNSATRGQWAGFELSAENQHSLWIPEDFAHGFLVLSETADVLYKVTAPYNSRAERTLKWDDPSVGVKWPIQEPPVLSAKDAQGQLWDRAELP